MGTVLQQLDVDVRKVFWSLHREVLELFYQWKIYRQLFDSGENNLEVLNRSGSNVFALMHNLVVNDTFLRLCRLTDPIKGSTRENLSFRYFVNRLGAIIAKEDRKRLKGQLAKLEGLTKSIRQHRNRRLAHLDLNSAIKWEGLPWALIDQINDALDLVNAIMKDLHFLVTNASTEYKDPSIAYGCDGEFLLRVLRGERSGQD
jgi:AbiU2